VRIKENDPVAGVSGFYGLGLVVNVSGLIAADRKTIVNGNIYTATMSDDTEFPLKPVGVSEQTNFLLFKPTLPEKVDPKNTYVFTPAILGDTAPQLGQTLIGLGGDSVNAVVVGRVVSLDIRDFVQGTTTTKYLAGIETDLATKDIVPGSPLFNLSGDVVGLKHTPDNLKLFLPVSVLKKDIATLTEATKSQ
jgi:S1-C subfamily serine protease